MEVLSTPVTVKIHVDGQEHQLAGIPPGAWEAFKRAAAKHFPDQEHAWAAAITEMILSMTTDTSYFLTGVPQHMSDAMSDTLDRVGWKWDAFHTYLLKSAAIPSAFRIIAFHEPENKKQQFGTLVITGLRKTVFTKIEQAAGVKLAEEVLGKLFQGIEAGTVQIDPKDFFTQTSES